MAEVSLSRHENKIRHRQLKEQADASKSGYEDMRKMLQEVNDSYIQLYEYFPVRRYPKLKNLIKRTVAQENMDRLRSKVEDSSQTEQGCPPSQIKEENENGKVEMNTERNEDRPLVSGGKPYGMIKQALRKVEKMCGLDNEPIEDEDVMTDDQLQKHIRKRTEEIQHYNSELTKIMQAMCTLKEKYALSKTSYFPFRFFKLKKAFQGLIRSTKPDSKYES
uniref:Uncharacterized protein n=1 Tax=Arion vulgaris TaxID=1028688 RepID=A0A0B7ALK7_9EUPU